LDRFDRWSGTDPSARAGAPPRYRPGQLGTGERSRPDAGGAPRALRSGAVCASILHRRTQPKWVHNPARNRYTAALGSMLLELRAHHSRFFSAARLSVRADREETNTLSSETRGCRIRSKPTVCLKRPAERRLCRLPEDADGLTSFCMVCRRFLPDGPHARVRPGRYEPWRLGRSNERPTPGPGTERGGRRTGRDA